MEKFKILIADDLLQCREDFVLFWNISFSKQYTAEFTECETAREALILIEETARSGNYFDIFVCDVDFSENQLHEDRIAGLEIIKKAKEINSKTQVIWYSAQKEDGVERFRTEDELRRRGYINFSIRKAFLSDLFHETMNNCIEAVRKNRTNLVIFLSKLFDTYNYGDDKNHDLGFYKLTHSNYNHQQMLSLLSETKKYFENSNEKDFLDNLSLNKINKYLANIETAYPSQKEMELFKSFFRLDFSDELLLSCQEPLLSKNIEVKNIFETTVPRIYCERERIIVGFKTIYENLAKHNFSTLTPDPCVTTTLKSNGSFVIITISANGSSFDPKETFTNNRTAGIAAIYECFNKYFDLSYESQGVSYNIYSSVSEISSVCDGVKITVSIPLPTLTAISGNIEDV